GSAPGDTLYGIDRALEKIGVGNGGAQERIAESNVLVDHGKTVEALDLLADSLKGESSEASEALKNASQRIQDIAAGSETADEVRLSVADMLHWMSLADLNRSDFGHGVAERAREIGKAHRPEDTGQGGDNPGQGGDNRGQGDQTNSGTPPGRSNG
ncbi:MAG TPA: hypothetical protein VE569_13460, partial [Acidimicrobiia bacterium]|nr:hypothetical protein [Acidimicrobiia bacterium]